MNKENWDIIRNCLNQDLADAPFWVRELLGYQLSEINSLPDYNGSSTEPLYQPACDTKKLEADYLEFLEQQIRLNARGEEWTNVLKQRLEALRPFVGREIMTVTFYGHSDAITLKVDPVSNRLIYFGE